MGFSYNVNVLNQKGSPAIYTDTFANRPSPGYAGRLFVSSDTSAIYEDTGTAWTLIANVSSGAGTLEQVTTNGNTTTKGISISAGGLSTNSLTDTALTSGSVTFAGSGGLISQDNANLFWDDTNNRLGINTNTPGNSLDVHTSGTTPILALNNTAGSQSAISFLNTSVAKWRIGNTATNTFDIYNFTLATIPFTISNADNRIDIEGNVFLQRSLALKTGSSNVSAAGYTLIHSLSGTGVEGVQFSLSTGGFGALLFNSSNNRQFTFPNADGTVALTSDLASYLPLTGGTLSGTLNGTSANFTSGIIANSGTINGTTDAFVDYNRALVDYANGVRLKTNGTNNFLLGCSGDNNFRIYNYGLAAFAININYATNNFLIGSNSDDTVNKLQVTGSIKATSTIESGGSVIVASTALLNFGPTSKFVGISGNNSTGALQLYANNAQCLIFNSSGVATLPNLGGTGSRAVLADASGVLSAPVSDISVKENIEPLKYGLKTIMKLNAVQFEFIEGYKNYGEGLQIGAIAQEVEQIIPEVVFKTPSTGLKGIDYNQFNGIYIKAIQEQQKIIEGLIQRIEALENK